MPGPMPVRDALVARLRDQVSYKALTLTQPWAALLVSGAKRCETRSWRTPYRGRLAVHAASTFPREARAASVEYHFARAIGGTALDLGAVVGFVTVVDVVRITCDCTLCVAKLATRHSPRDRSTFDGVRERQFGDWSPGRWAWVCADAVRLPEPIPAKGALGIWEWRP